MNKKYGISGQLEITRRKFVFRISKRATDSKGNWTENIPIEVGSAANEIKNKLVFQELINTD